MSQSTFSRITTPLVLTLLFLGFHPCFAQSSVLPGDVDGNGVVNHRDFFLYALHFDPSGHLANVEADGNSDRMINSRDLYLAIFARLLGQGPFNPPGPEGTGAVIGRILEDPGDAASALPVPSAEVWIGNSNGFRLKTTADDQGAFGFKDVPAGEAMVYAHHPSYHSREVSIQVIAEGTTEVLLRLPPRRQDLASVQGYVRGTHPAAFPFYLPGATVRIFPEMEADEAANLEPSHQPGMQDPDQRVLTDHRGWYEIHDLPSGQYRMVVYAAGYETERRSIYLEAPDVRNEDFILFPLIESSASLSGRVTAPQLAAKPAPSDSSPTEPFPLEGAQVLVESWIGPPAPNEIPPDGQMPFPPFRTYETTTDASGEYRLASMIPGLYRIHVWSAGYEPASATIELASGESGVRDFELVPHLIEEGTVAGTVFGVTRDAFALPVPLEDALVSLMPRWELFPADPATGIVSDLYPPHIRSTTTDSQGRYRFASVPTGEYLLVARAAHWGRATAEVQVVAEGTSTVDLFIAYWVPPDAGSLSGRVVEAAPDLAQATPIAGAKIKVLPIDPVLQEPYPLFLKQHQGGAMPGPDGVLWTETNSEGEYSLAHLPAGHYYLFVLAEGFLPAESLVEVGSGQNTVADFSLTHIDRTYGLVLGTVMTEPAATGESAPIPGAILTLVPTSFPIPATDLKGIIGDPLWPVYEVVTNGLGQFEFPSVASGEYILHVQAGGFQPKRLQVGVEPGDQVTLSIQLQAEVQPGNGQLEGHVYSLPAPYPPGVLGAPMALSPVAGAWVLALSLDDPIPPDLTLPGGGGNLEGFYPQPSLTRTDQQGFYRFENLPSGPVVVVVYADGFDPFFGDTSIDPGQVTTFDVWLIQGGVPSGPSLRGHVFQNTFDPTFAPVPVPGARVVLQTEPIPGTDPPELLFETLAEENGYYEFSEIPAGRYVVWATAEGFAPPDRIPVRIETGIAQYQDVVLQPVYSGEGALSGNVYSVNPNDPSVPPLEHRVPLAGAAVRLVPEGLVVIAIFPPPNVGFDRITDESGEYRFDSLPAGIYQAVIFKEGYQSVIDRLLIVDGDDQVRDWVLPSVDAHTQLQIRVQQDTGPLDVWIPISGAQVNLQEVNGSGHRNGQTDENGDLVFTDLAPSTYQVTVQAQGHMGEDRQVTLSPGEDRFELFQLVPLDQFMIPGNLEGRVFLRGEGGNLRPVPYVPVTFRFGIPTMLPEPITLTDSEGNYRFEGLLAGSGEVLVGAGGVVVAASATVEILPNATVHQDLEILVGDGQTVPGF